MNELGSKCPEKYYAFSKSLMPCSWILLLIEILIFHVPCPNFFQFSLKLSFMNYFANRNLFSCLNCFQLLLKRKILAGTRIRASGQKVVLDHIFDLIHLFIRLDWFVVVLLVSKQLNCYYEALNFTNEWF